ncbi:hypothetical protein F4781DRAFT_445497 [Annulohypoxylon bovei var. microspora]|nr:hypothetical protein F4781DRAFT_445497 [Annulohypoxylon bovei var. microspora]
MSHSSQTRRASVADTEYAVPDTPQPIEQLPDKPAWDIARLVLRIVSTTLSAPLLAISLAGFAAPKGFSGFPIMGTSLSALALIYDISEYIVMCVQKRKTGIRPTISLGFELVVSLVGIALSALLITFTADSYIWHDYYDGRAGTPVPGYVENGRLWFALSIIASILGTVLSLVHFVLFVRDCVEVHWYRKGVSTSQEKESAANSTFELDGIEDKKGPPVSPPTNGIN